MQASHAPALPTFWEVNAPTSWSCIEFISDLHLAADTPRTFQAFAAHLRHTDADAVFVLGDLFEVWVGDDVRHEGFEAMCADVLSDAATRRTIGFMAGNRDFLVGADLLKHCGLMALADPTVLCAFGDRLLLTHGDALCLSDRAYQEFRAQVRSAAWRNAFLARPLPERRRLGREIRAESERRKANEGRDAWSDVDTAAAVRWLHEAGATTLLHGHTHRPGSESLAPGFMRHVLSDWDLDHPPLRAEVLRWQRGVLTRSAPTAG